MDKKLRHTRLSQGLCEICGKQIITPATIGDGIICSRNSCLKKYYKKQKKDELLGGKIQLKYANPSERAKMIRERGFQSKKPPVGFSRANKKAKELTAKFLTAWETLDKHSFKQTLKEIQEFYNRLAYDYKDTAVVIISKLQLSKRVLDDRLVNGLRNKELERIASEYNIQDEKYLYDVIWNPFYMYLVYILDNEFNVLAKTFEELYPDAKFSQENPYFDWVF